MSKTDKIPMRSDETGAHSETRSAVDRPARAPKPPAGPDRADAGDGKGRPTQEERPEGAHDTPDEAAVGRGDEGGKVTRKGDENERDPETGELAWKERIKRQTGGG